jgi:hypothetical protein
MSDDIKHKCGIALIRLLKAPGVLPAEVRVMEVWTAKALPADGEAA